MNSARPPDPRLSAGSPANDPAAVAAVLCENLSEMSALLDRLCDADLDRRPAADEWSVREIVLHVIQAERWLQPQLLELRRTIAGASPVPAIGDVRLPEASSRPDLNELRWAVNAVRDDTLRTLEGLEAAQLREPANLGAEEEAVDVSLRTLFLTVADHQLFHVRQIERTMGLR